MKRRAVVTIGLLHAMPNAALGRFGRPSSPPLPIAAPAVARPTRPAAAFSATTVPTALAALGAAGASPGTAIRVEAPSIAADLGPAMITVSAELSGVTQVALLVDPAPFALAALLRPDGVAQPWQVTIDVERTTRVTVAVQAEGKWYSVSREIKVAAQRW